MRSLCTSLASLSVAALVGGGCATVPARKATEGEKVCVDSRDINTIRALDDRHAFVKVRAGHFYLLTLDKTCTGMKFARTIAVVEATTRVCGDGFSFLSFEDPVVGPMRCRIERIDPVVDQNAAEDLIKSRE